MIKPAAEAAGRVSEAAHKRTYSPEEKSLQHLMNGKKGVPMQACSLLCSSRDANMHAPIMVFSRMMSTTSDHHGAAANGGGISGLPDLPSISPFLMLPAGVAA